MRGKGNETGKRERESKREKEKERGQDNGVERRGAPSKVSSTAASDTSRLTAILPSGPTIYP